MLHLPAKKEDHPLPGLLLCQLPRCGLVFMLYEISLKKLTSSIQNVLVSIQTYALNLSLIRSFLGICPICQQKKIFALRISARQNSMYCYQKR